MKIMRPRLPYAEQLIPYLKGIDVTRWYSNFGPMVNEYELRLGERFGCGAVSTSSCTSGLTSALIALNLPKGSMVAVPGWTFVATAAAIVMAGYTPFFVDVDSTDWVIDISKIKYVKAVVVVSPFGAPLYMEKWESLGIPVIIDAAGGFDIFSQAGVGRIPVVISTHCTKVFGTGEGGMVLSTDDYFLKKVRQITNFGFDERREVSVVGINAKMSEYHASVALAELDSWEEKRKKWLEVKEYYVKIFKDIGADNPVMDCGFVGSLFPLFLPNHRVAPLVKFLSEKGIASRQVWGMGVHRYQAYKEYPRGDMKVTDYLCDSVIFLPMALDLTMTEMDKVKDAVSSYLGGK